MEEWATFCSKPMVSGEVVTLRTGDSLKAARPGLDPDRAMIRHVR